MIESALPIPKERLDVSNTYWADQLNRPWSVKPRNITNGYRGFWWSDEIVPKIEFLPQNFDSSREIVIEIEMDVILGCIETGFAVNVRVCVRVCHVCMWSITYITMPMSCRVCVVCVSCVLPVP